MYKKKRLASLIVAFAMVFQLFTAFSATASAKETENVVTKAYLTDSHGKVVDKVNKYDYLQLNVEFALPNGRVHKGDTTTIKIPKELRVFEDQTFEIKSPDKKVIAVATVNKDEKTITLKYTDYVDKHSDVKGKLYVSSAIDSQVLKEYKKVKLQMTVNGNVTIEVGEIDHTEPPGDQSGEKFTKYSWQDSPNGTKLHYRLRVNANGDNYNNVVVGDKLLSEGLEYDKSSFKIYKGKWKLKNKNYELEDETDVTNQYQVKFTENDRGFEINLGNITNGEGYYVKYTASVKKYAPQHGEVVKNKGWMKAEGNVNIEAESHWKYQFSGGSGEGYTFSIKIFKKDKKGTGLQGAEFEVIRDVSGEVVGKIKTDAAGNGSIGNLLKDNYTIKETKAPEGYVKSNEVIKVTPNDFAKGTKEAFKEIVNKKIEKTSISGKKIWDDKDDQDGKRPKEIKVSLYANDKKIKEQTVKPDAGGNWNYKFDNLDKYDSNGQEIKYTVKEEKVEGYTTSYNGNDITNKHIPETIEIKGDKKWLDDNNKDKKRPDEITVGLYKGNTKIKETKATKNNNWEFKFENLPKYEKGKKIEYTVKEEAVEGYSSSIKKISDNVYQIVNTITGKVAIPVNKTWVGPKAKKAVVKLLANDVEKEKVELNEGNNWSHTFANLDKYDKQGKRIKYTLKEEPIANYDGEITGDAESGFTVRNKNIEKVKIPVEKTWVGPKQKEVTVRLFADDVEKASAKLNEANGWKHEFKDLPKYSDNGTLIKYTVKEDKVTNYDTEITGDANKGFKITNKNTEKVKVPVEKTWVGPKQKEVTVRLFADDVEKASAKLNEANGWKHEFKDLPKYNDNGTLIKYTVKEDKVANYETQITGNAKDGFKIKNTNTEKTKISVDKTWVGPAKDKAVIKLLADGIEKEKVTLNKANNWKHTFDNLLKYDQKTGKEIKYEIKEETVKDYKTEITGNAKDGYKVKNTNIEKIKIPVVKKWIGKELEKVTIKLYADGKKIEEIELSKTNNWKHEFKNLPKYDEKTGKKIKYTIEENKVSGYITNITGDSEKGFTVVNKEVPPAKTGDNSNNGLYGGLMAIALAGSLGAGYVGRRRKNSR